MRIKTYPGARIKAEPFSTVNKGEDLEIAVLPPGASNSDKWKLGGCPRCHGDVFLDSEDGEVLGHCLQCGYVGVRIVPTASKPPPEG
jgi:hypothetical protein